MGRSELMSELQFNKSAMPPGDPQSQRPVVDSEERFLPRKCGDPFRIFGQGTEGNRDPWADIASGWPDKLFSKKEIDRCNRWKAEIQNLLVFAGLFSAIVTGFLIESYSSLKADTTEVLLSRILSRMDFAINGSVPAIGVLHTADIFQPASSDKRINALWFLSLVSSLGTVLASMLTLQWIHEYQQGPSPGQDSRIWLSLHHMYTESLDRWYLPQIVAFLPIPLQLGLILFFIGLGEFVWNLDVAVAISSILAIAVTLLFFVATTVAPTLQALTLFAQRTKGKDSPPRVPCPYKSPLASLFQRLVICLIRFCSKLPIRAIRQFFLHNDRREMLSSKLKHILIFNIFFAHSGHGWEDSWHFHGIGWLFQRDLDELRRHGLRKSEEDIGRLSGPDSGSHPQYDALRVLVKIRDSPVTSREEHFSINTCFSNLHKNSKFSSTRAKSKNDEEKAYGQYIHTLLMDRDFGNGDGWRRYRLRVPVEYGSPRPASLLRESNEFMFRSTWNSRTADISREVREDLIERAIRLINWMFSDGPRSVDGFKADLYLDYTPVTLLAHEFEADRKSFYESKPRHPLQLAEILRSFLHSARDFTYTPPLAPTSFTSEYTNEFLSVSAKVLGAALLEESKAEHNIGLAPHLGATLTDVAATLHEWVNTIRLTVTASTTMPNRPDYLFFVLYIFESNLPTTYSHLELRTAIADYTNYLRSQESSSLDTTLADALKIGWAMFTADWETQGLSPTARARDYVVVVPPSAVVDEHYRLPINTPALEQSSALTAVSDNPVPNESGGQTIQMQEIHSTNVSSPRTSAESQPLLSDPEAGPTDRPSIDNAAQRQNESAGSEPRIDIVTPRNKSLSRVSIADHRLRDSGVGPSPSLGHSDRPGV